MYKNFCCTLKSKVLKSLILTSKRLIMLVQSTRLSRAKLLGDHASALLLKLKILTALDHGNWCSFGAKGYNQGHLKFSILTALACKSEALDLVLCTSMLVIKKTLFDCCFTNSNKRSINPFLPLCLMLDTRYSHGVNASHVKEQRSMEKKRSACIVTDAPTNKNYVWKEKERLILSFT